MPTFDVVNRLFTRMGMTSKHLTRQNWDHRPNPRHLAQLVGPHSSPDHLLSRIGTLTQAQVQGLAQENQRFIRQLVKYVLGGVAATNLKNEVQANALVTFINNHPFQDTFGIPLTEPQGARHDASNQQINEIIDDLVPTNEATTIRNPKVASRAQVRTFCHRLLINAKGQLTDENPRAVIPVASFRRTLRNVIMTFADVGSTRFAELGTIEMTVFYYATPDAAQESTQFVSAHTLVRSSLAQQGISARRMFRYFCNPAIDFAKRAGHSYRLGMEHGVPPAYGFLGFDFADVYVAGNATEAIVIRQAKRSGLFRERNSGGAHTNTGTLYNPDGFDRSGSGQPTRQ